MAKMISPLTGTLQSIKKQFISKEKLLKSTLNVQKKRINLNRSNAERERFIDYEKVLERPLRSLGTGIKSVVGKRLGFLDTLKTFIVNLLLGFIALRLLKYLPQLIQFATTALKVGNFILDIGGKILNGLVTFVDYGYKAYDHARKIVGKVGGEKAVANLDKATDETTKVINQLLIAGMLFSDFSPFAGLSGAPKAMEAAADAIKNKVSGEVANAATDAATKTAGKAALGPIGSAGIIIGAGLLFSAAGEGVFQLTKWTKGLIGFGPISKFFQVPLGILEGVGTLFDIVGAPFRYGIELVRAGFMKMFNMKDGLEKQSKNLGKFDARIRENFRRLSGVFAPVFSFFGQQDTAKKLSTPGSFGSLYGEKAVKDMGYSGGGKVISVRKYAAGGPVNIPRTEVKEVDIPRGETIKQAPTKPGASIGGKERFAEVFPDSGNDTSKMDRYGYMISSYDTISGIPDLGAVFALTTKALLGDQVTKDDYDRASSSLSSFMLLGLYETNPEAYQKFSSLIDIKQFNRSISGFLMKSMSMPLGGIINLLKIQVGLIPKPGDPSGSEADPCAAACDTGSGSGVAVSGDGVDKAILDLISSVEAKDYDTMNVSRGATAGKPTQMTVDWLVANANGAIGRYQQMPQYLLGRVIAAGGKGSDKFTPELQDRTALKMLYDGHGFARWRSGQMTDSDFGNRLSATWRGLPHSSGGTYPDRYAGRNKAHMSRDAFMTRLTQIRAGNTSGAGSIAPSSPAGSVDPCICDPETPDASNLNMGAESVTTSISGVVNPIPSQNISSNKGGYAADTGLDILTPIGSKVVSSVSGILEYAEKGHVAQMGQDANPNMPGMQDQHSVRIALDKPFSYKGKTVNFFYATHLYDLAIGVKNKKGIKISAGTPLGLSGVANKVPHVHVGYVEDRAQNSFLNYLEVKSMLSSARESGGPTLSGGIRQLHKGEYVIDKDSVDLFGGTPFFSMINGVENEKQRSEKSSQLIQHLSKYTGRKIDQRPEMIVENSDPIIIQGPPTYIASGSSGGSFGGSSSNDKDNTFDRLELMA
jgi:hypothetical protein